MKSFSLLLSSYAVLSLCSCASLTKDKAEIKKILVDIVDEAVDEAVEISEGTNDNK